MSPEIARPTRTIPEVLAALDLSRREAVAARDVARAAELRLRMVSLMMFATKPAEGA